MRRMINVLVTRGRNGSLRRYRRRQGDDIETNPNEMACPGVDGVISFG
jgi:hypothetical protein